MRMYRYSFHLPLRHNLDTTCALIGQKSLEIYQYIHRKVKHLPIQQDVDGTRPVFFFFFFSIFIESI